MSAFSDEVLDAAWEKARSAMEADGVDVGELLCLAADVPAGYVDAIADVLHRTPEALSADLLDDEPEPIL